MKLNNTSAFNCCLTRSSPDKFILDLITDHQPSLYYVTTKCPIATNTETIITEQLLSGDVAGLGKENDNGRRILIL